MPTFLPIYLSADYGSLRVCCNRIIVVAVTWCSGGLLSLSSSYQLHFLLFLVDYGEDLQRLSEAPDISTNPCFVSTPAGTSFNGAVVEIDYSRVAHSVAKS
ncbi:hypothetical protein V1264_009509 [Littorina saxatilis]|uniref:Uncharacterized protein n=1 Tax=Littorina saxatilis TaxID=31220 RepID=A0AAN9ARK6_9CAEN